MNSRVSAQPAVPEMLQQALLCYQNQEVSLPEKARRLQLTVWYIWYMI